MTAPGVTLSYCRRWLGRNFPSLYRVFVVKRPGQTIGKSHGVAYCHGDTAWFLDDAEQAYAIIRLATGDAVTAQIETLLHEWAHVLVGHIPDWKTLGDPDSSVFDAMHGEIRRAWFGQPVVQSDESS